MEELRRQARLEADVACTVATGVATFEARVVNLSLGGAALCGPPDAAVPGDQMMLMLERPGEGVSLALPAVVLRVGPALEGVTYGVRFEPLPPDVRNELVRLLRLLADGKGRGRRESPRVARRLVCTFHQPAKLQAVLNDLSRGGFSVRVSRPMELGAMLHASFGVDGYPGLFELEGPVVNVTPIENNLFRIGVKFEGLSPERLERIKELIDVLLGLPSLRR